jgi:hypothetical protein
VFSGMSWKLPPVASAGLTRGFAALQHDDSQPQRSDGVGQVVRGRRAGETCADDDDVGALGWLGGGAEGGKWMSTAQPEWLAIQWQPGRVDRSYADPRQKILERCPRGWREAPVAVQGL